jgi:hypothetical protein
LKEFQGYLLLLLSSLLLGKKKKKIKAPGIPEGTPGSFTN